MKIRRWGLIQWSESLTGIFFTKLNELEIGRDEKRRRGSFFLSVGLRDLGVNLDAASTSVVVLLELDIALVAPGGVPGILDEPIVHAVLTAVSNDEHGVVDDVAAGARAYDTGRVIPEDVLVSLDADSNRLLNESSQHLVRVIRTNVFVAHELDVACLGCAVVAV